MNTKNYDSPDNQEKPESQSETFNAKIPSTSATTNEDPVFGWKAYGELINGRFAMLGFTCILLIEILSHDTFLHWAGFIP